MRKGARVIIIDDGKILLMHRVKTGWNYFVLPGGGIEEGETPTDAALREIKEETNLDVEIEFLWEFEEVHDKNYGYYFLAKNFSGELKLGGPEEERISAENQYFLEWTPLADIAKLNLYPEELKKRISELSNK